MTTDDDLEQDAEEIDKIMEEKDCDRETAWTLQQDRKERKMIADAHSVTKALEQETENLKNKSLMTVHDVYKKYLCIPDTRRIDLILAIAISKRTPGTPIWCIIVGSSGDAKSECIRPLMHWDNTMVLDDMTPNALASGKSDTIKDKKTGDIITLSPNDKGSKLQNASTLILFPDMATMSSKNSDDKSLIWAQFRSLYDGNVTKSTGNGVERKYENCHVTMIGCSTNVLRDELIIHSQLGSREFIWDTGLEEHNDIEYKDKEAVNKKKTEMAWTNEAYEEQMRKEIEATTLEFLKYHKFVRIPDENIPDTVKQFIIKEANRLRILRANVIVDQQHREVINPVIPETPTRVIKQLKKLYIAIRSLDKDYDDRRALSIIKTIVDSSGNVVRKMVMDIMRIQTEKWFTIRDIQEYTKIGRNSVKAQLEILWNLGIIDKETKYIPVGGYEERTKDKDGNEKIQIKGMQTREIETYKWVISDEYL